MAYENRFGPKSGKRSPALRDPLEAAAAHERYIHSVAVVTGDITRAKTIHGQHMRFRRDTITRKVAKGVANLAEAEWRRDCERVRRSGLEVGKVVMWANFCWTDGMPDSWPTELPTPEGSAPKDISQSPSADAAQPKVRQKHSKRSLQPPDAADGDAETITTKHVSSSKAARTSEPLGHVMEKSHAAVVEDGETDSSAPAPTRRGGERKRHEKDGTGAKKVKKVPSGTVAVEREQGGDSAREGQPSHPDKNEESFVAKMKLRYAEERTAMNGSRRVC
jgi:hypothetical protein